MTDRVQKIREEVVEIINSINLFTPDEDGKNSSYEAGKFDVASKILQVIDSLQEESVSNPIDFEQELYKAFGQVKDFTLGMRIAKWFYDMGKNSQEPVSIWHDASEEPEDKANCLIHYIVGGKVTYTDMFPVLYHKDGKEFVSVPYPHTTGYKIEQKSLEGGVVADVYKNMRDRFPLTDISKWAYISDLLNLDNSCNFGKNLQEEPLSDDLEEAAKNHAVERFRTTRDEFLAEKCKWSFKAGAKWNKMRMIDIVCKWIEETSHYASTNFNVGNFKDYMKNRC